MVGIHVYSDAEIERARQKTVRLLKEFPELWALRQDWGVHGWKYVKICRAPAIGFLEKGICPSADMKSIKAYIVTDRPSMEDVTITRAGNHITGIGQYKIGDPDGIALRELVCVELWFHTFSKEVLGDVPYVFLLEEGDGSGPWWQVTIVKPPAGQKTFEKYINKVPQTLDVAT